MVKIKNLFARGIMDKDRDRSFLEKNAYRHNENLRFHNDGKDGVGQNIKGTAVVSDVTTKDDGYKCIGALFNEDKNVIYYMLATDAGDISKVVEYNIDTQATEVVLHDTNATLKFDKSGYITGINEIDGLLLWSEWGNNPRRINVERAKGYGINGYTEDDIMVCVKPPLNKLKITLESATTPTQLENNIEEKMLYFSYQYKYLDGEYSALAPFSEAAFFPKNFNYDFSEQSNPTMINKFNQVDIEFDTGSERVVEIRLVYKESESNVVYIVDDFNKLRLGYGDNEAQSFKYNNQKAKGILSATELPKYFDNVPLTNRAQTMIDGRLIYANYVENYDIKDDLGNKIELDYTLEPVYLDNFILVDENDYDEDGNFVGVIQVERPSKIPLETVKSNRDYEVGIVYLDDHGRSSTVLVSKQNTIHIPVKQSVTGNSIDVILKHKPPYWAKKYRFFIKQNRRAYDHILPTLFYEDGSFRWVKLEGADKDKVKEGDYLVVKADTQDELENLVKVKVLEIKEQDKNFLQADDKTDEIIERSGLYFKIKPKGFRLDLDDFINYHLETYDNTRNAYNSPINNIDTYISQPHFYGDTLNDLSSNSPFTGGAGVYTGGNDDRTRYVVKIDGLGAPDTFSWSDDGGATFPNTGIAITGAAQALSKGVEITFGSTTGHSLNDEWAINARGTWSTKNSGRAYGFFRTTDLHGETLEDPTDETIESGARIYLEYSEYGRGNDSFVIDEISGGRYDNIEEWFHKEGILAKITAQSTLVYDDIHFMRGTLSKSDNATKITQNDTDGTMTICVRSAEHGTGASRVKVRATSDIIQTDGDSIVLFETEGKEELEEVFFEVGKTYDIVNGYHISDNPNIPTDIDQTAVADLRVKLDFFNAFSYGNAVESFKIKDDFNTKGLDVGERSLATTIDEYQQVTRTANFTWSDVYSEETNFNGLGSFNLSLLNFIELNREQGSIQKLHNRNTTLVVLQEDASGTIPYQRNIVEDAGGGQLLRVSEDVFNKGSYRSYVGIGGISKEPESFVAIGNRAYFTDKDRGHFIRLSIDGRTAISENLMDDYFANIMIDNKQADLVGGYDPNNKEVLLSLPSTNSVLAFREKSQGFPLFFTYTPDFMIHADGELYSWKNGVMYKHHASETRNNFYGVQYESKIKFYVNQEFSTEMIFKALGIESTHAWLANLATKLTSRTIPKDCFEKKEDYWFSEIMGNTNGEALAESSFGLGTQAIVNGEILTTRKYQSLSVGDIISGTTIAFTPSQVVDIQDDKIILADNINVAASFLKYSKNQNVDGAPIKGDVLEIELINNDSEAVELRAVNTEVAKSYYS